MRITIALMLIVSLSFTACQNKAGEEDNTTTEQQQVEEKKYTLTPFSSTFEFPDANLTSMAYEDGTFKYSYSGYELGQQTPDADSKMCANSDKGSHIHLIVNTQPYIAKYTSEFTQDLEDGDYHILSFLSRSYHESIKNGTAHIAKKASVVNKAITATEDITDPMLFYSRPKGTYVGKKNTEKVMLDFFLTNADLGSNYKVNANINGEDHLIDNWQPYYIEGLPMGENLITLTLVDGAGNKVDSPLNPVSRKFTLQEDKTESL